MNRTSLYKCLGFVVLFCSLFLTGGKVFAVEPSNNGTEQSNIAEGTTLSSYESSDLTVESDTEQSFSSSEQVVNDFGDKKLDVVKGETFSYRLVFEISNEQVFKSVVLQDDLESVFDIHSASVASLNVAGEEMEVTKDGDLTIDKERNLIEWKAKNPGDFFGRYLFLDITVSIKDDADLTQYENANGQFVVPNVGALFTDKDKTETDQVNVVLDPIQPTDSSELAEPLPQTGSDHKKLIGLSLLFVATGAGGGIVYSYRRMKKSGK